MNANFVIANKLTLSLKKKYYSDHRQSDKNAESGVGIKTTTLERLNYEYLFFNTLYCPI